MTMAIESNPSLLSPARMPACTPAPSNFAPCSLEAIGPQSSYQTSSRFSRAEAAFNPEQAAPSSSDPALALA